MHPSHEQQFKKVIDEMEEAALVYKNPNSRWASPVMFTRKPGAKQLPVQGTMPDIDKQLKAAAGCDYFISFDLLKGYNQADLYISIVK